MNDTFAANVVDRPDGLVLEVVGEVDMTSGTYLSRVIEGLRSDERATRLRLDLSRLTFIDSQGIGMVLAAWRTWTAEGKPVEIVRGPANVMRAFEVSGLAATLPFVDA